MNSLKTWVKLFFAGVISALGVVFAIFLSGKSRKQIDDIIKNQTGENNGILKKDSDYLNSHPERKEL